MKKFDIHIAAGFSKGGEYIQACESDTGDWVRAEAADELLTALTAAVLHIERMNLTATEQASTPQSEVDHMNAVIDTA